MVKLDKQAFIQYSVRAAEFFQAMKDEEDFERYNAATLLGIHAAIALSDAITVAVLGERFAGENHAQAIKLLGKACDTARVSNRSGIEKLGKIVTKKNTVAYEEHVRTIDTRELQKVRLQVERFFDWGYTCFKILREEEDKLP